MATGEEQRPEAAETSWIREGCCLEGGCFEDGVYSQEGDPADAATIPRFSELSEKAAKVGKVR